jgi:hypothetical protein
MVCPPERWFAAILSGDDVVVVVGFPTDRVFFAGTWRVQILDHFFCSQGFDLIRGQPAVTNSTERAVIIEKAIKGLAGAFGCHWEDSNWLFDDLSTAI